MRAISAFNREVGMSTRVCLAVTALRIRVSMSAIGSVISLNLCRPRATGPHSRRAVHQLLPAALGHPGHVAFERQLPETQTAERELPHVGARPAAQAAPV